MRWKTELDRLAKILSSAAEAEIVPRFRHVSADRKADGSLVTEADLAVQRRIASALAESFPGIPLLGEEMTDAEQQALFERSDEGLWVLDPLDGTSNFACGFPAFAISLALIEEGRPVLGVVLDPVRGECFTAARGQGAFLNGEPIEPYALAGGMSDCLAMVDLKRLRGEHVARILEPGVFRSQRSLGCVALEWAWLAAGRFQLYLHGSQRLWDYAAGRLIALEAGVPSVLYRPADLAPDAAWRLEARMAVAASNSELLQRWVDILALPSRP